MDIMTYSSGSWSVVPRPGELALLGNLLERQISKKKGGRFLDPTTHQLRQKL